MTSSELDTEAQRPFNCFGICCYAVFVGFLICLVIMAIAPTILWTLLELLGINKFERKPKPPEVENDNLTNALQTPAADVGATRAPFLDIAETFGEIGVDEDLPDGAFAALNTSRNNSDYVFDLLRLFANQTASTSTQPTTSDRLLLRKRRTTNGITGWHQSYASHGPHKSHFLSSVQRLMETFVVCRKAKSALAIASPRTRQLTLKSHHVVTLHQRLGLRKALQPRF
ncbi:hypothetical protein MRX96_016385 [Rhipicephalus microplus]